MSKKRNNSYSDEFKKEAVRQTFESGKSKSQIARDLGISDSLLYGWINKFDEAKSKGITPKELDDEKAEIRQLKAENKQLQEEIELLKKASAYFAKNQK